MAGAGVIIVPILGYVCRVHMHFATAEHNTVNDQCFRISRNRQLNKAIFVKLGHNYEAEFAHMIKIVVICCLLLIMKQIILQKVLCFKFIINNSLFIVITITAHCL